MNPWKKENILNLFRNILRFALWICLVVNGLMISVFSIVFTYNFLHSLWSYLWKRMFSEPW